MLPSRTFPLISWHRRVKARVAGYRYGWFKAVVWVLFGAMAVLLFPAMVAAWFWRLSRPIPPRRGRRVSMLVLAALAGVAQLLWLNALIIDPMAGIGEALNQPPAPTAADGPIAADPAPAEDEPSDSGAESGEQTLSEGAEAGDPTTTSTASTDGATGAVAEPSPNQTTTTLPETTLPPTTTSDAEAAGQATTTTVAPATTAPPTTSTTDTTASPTTTTAPTTTTTAPPPTTTTTVPPTTTTTAPPPTTTTAPPPPTTTTTTTTRPATTQPTGGAPQVLSGLGVAAESNGGVAYDRDLYGSWRTVRSGCNTRCAVLEAEARSDGTWLSWFDGRVISTSSQLDIDHMVPLAEAHSSGAWQWSSSRRRDFANDLIRPETLTAVSASSNRSKGARDPAEWRPPQRSAWCRYATDWITVKISWGLTADRAEVNALEEMLDTCGSEVALGTVTATTAAVRITTTTSATASTGGSACPYTSRAGNPCAAIPALGNQSNDVNCGDIPNRFKPLTVVGQDYDRLDGNNDGQACTS